MAVNIDEGEPGTFKDRWILEHAPHLLLELMLIAAFALQVRHAFVYIRGEFDLPYRRLAAAVEEAYDAGLLGEQVMGSGFACDLVVYRGAGSYVCGEASALMGMLIYLPSVGNFDAWQLVTTCNLWCDRPNAHALIKDIETT